MLLAVSSHLLGTELINLTPSKESVGPTPLPMGNGELDPEVFGLYPPSPFPIGTPSE